MYTDTKPTKCETCKRNPGMTEQVSYYMSVLIRRVLIPLLPPASLFYVGYGLAWIHIFENGPWDIFLGALTTCAGFAMLFWWLRYGGQYDV